MLYVCECVYGGGGLRARLCPRVYISQSGQRDYHLINMYIMTNVDSVLHRPR
jgi:hypothetical protein